MTRRRGDHGTLDMFRDYTPPELVAAHLAPEMTGGGSLDMKISRAVAHALTASGKSRADIAEEMSNYLDQRITENMLDVYPKAPIRPEVESTRAVLVEQGVDGSVPLAQARANAGLQPLPDKPDKMHVERHADFQERLARYHAGEKLRLVEPRDLGDAIILGARRDGSVMVNLWRGGVMNPSPTKPALFDFDGRIVDKIDRGNSDEPSTESPDDIETGGILLERLGAQVEILDDAISAATAERIARDKGLAPEYAKVEGARMVDRALDNLYALLRPVAEKTRITVTENDNEEIMQNISA